MLSIDKQDFKKLTDEFEIAQKDFKKSMYKIPVALNKLIRKTSNFYNFSKNLDITREALYSALSENGNPKLYTFLTILNALDLKIKVVKKSEKRIPSWPCVSSAVSFKIPKLKMFGCKTIQNVSGHIKSINHFYW